jgi:hypothetical protein
LRRIYRYLDGQLGFQRISRNSSPLEFLGCVFPAYSVVSCLSVKVATSFHALSTNSRGSSDTLLSDLAYTMSQDAFLHGLDDALACRKLSTGSHVPLSLLLGAILQECNKRTNSMRVVQGCARISSRRRHAHTSLYSVKLFATHFQGSATTMDFTSFTNTNQERLSSSSRPRGKSKGYRGPELRLTAPSGTKKTTTRHHRIHLSVAALPKGRYRSWNDSITYITDLDHIQ